MFGLEKKEPEKFTFDLEKIVKESPKRKAEMLAKIGAHIQELKNMLREGANEKDFEKLGVLLNGYMALQKVLNKITA
ncbi:MAG TPA: needle chaperone SctE [Parachlamydiales bacterium]|nr:needle chaperone SctE [Parachlamydiales bacterium]